MKDEARLAVAWAWEFKNEALPILLFLGPLSKLSDCTTGYS